MRCRLADLPALPTVNLDFVILGPIKVILCDSRATREGPQSLRNPTKHVRTQDWHDQGQELSQTQQPKRQLSVCIQLEVKLAEALDRCDSLSPPQADDDGQVLPNKLRTAVCCKASSHKPPVL